MTENKTTAFLGNPYSWSKTQIKLDDVQPLHGGIIVRLPGWTMSQAFVSRAAPDGQETKYRLPLALDEKWELCQLFVAHDFLTIQPQQRPGLPDEARPTITLTNPRRESHSVAKWAGVKDSRFDAVYHALLAIGERSQGQKPIPPRFNRWQKALFGGSVGTAILLLFLLAYGLARPLVMAWWPERFSLLLALLFPLWVALLVTMRGLAWLERRKPHWERAYTHLWVLIAVNFLFFLTVIALIGLGEAAISAWRAETPLTAGDERALYAVLGYAALFAAALVLAAAGMLVPPLLRIVNERF